MIFTLVFCVWKIKPINVKVWFLPAKRSWGILFHLIKQWLWALYFPSSLTFWLWNESMWWRDKGVGIRLGGIKREFSRGGVACVLVICKIWMNIFDRLVSCNGGGLEARLPPPRPLSSKSREKSTSVVSLFGRPLQIIPVLKGKISLSLSLSSAGLRSSNNCRALFLLKFALVFNYIVLFSWYFSQSFLLALAAGVSPL